MSSHLEDDFDLSVVVETWASIGDIPRLAGGIGG